MEIKVLFVCLGNICRSPMAEGLFESKVNEKGLRHFKIDSAGTSNYHIGESPDRRMTETALNRGIKLSSRARQFVVQDFDEFDFIYVMDNYNLRDVLDQARNEEDEKKVDMILNKIYPGQNMSVPDPYYGGEEGFENVYQLLDAACDKIIEDLAYND